MLKLRNHKKGTGAPWTVELHFIPLPMAETMVHYQHFQRNNKNKIASIAARKMHLFYYTFPWTNGKTCKTKGKRNENNQHLLGGELCLPWPKEVGELLCGLISATLNSRLSNSHITPTQNHLVWLLALAEPYHDNVARVKSGVRAKEPFKQCWLCFLSRSNNSIRVWVFLPCQKLQKSEVSL